MDLMAHPGEPPRIFARTSADVVDRHPFTGQEPRNDRLAPLPFNDADSSLQPVDFRSRIVIIKDLFPVCRRVVHSLHPLIFTSQYNPPGESRL